MTHDEVYRFRRTPFGLSSAPFAFQQMMATIVSGIKEASVFMDDIVVHGATQESHDHRLKQVLQKLTDHKLTLNENKCIFSKRQVEFLGYVISAQGIMTQRSNVKAIQEVPSPTSSAELASFLGMGNYYPRFVQDYAEITTPLRRLLKQDVPWK